MINIGSTTDSRDCEDSSRSSGSNSSTYIRERKIESEKLTNKSHITRKEYHVRDDNNNGDLDNQVRTSVAQRGHSKSGDSSSSDCASHETEEWQILEVDEQLKFDSAVAQIESKDIMSDDINANEFADAYGVSRRVLPRGAGKLYSEYGTKSDKKYVDIDPLGSEKDNEYSPSLVYLCTAIYSLLPVAATFALFGLISLLFTRFYFITLLYFAYILWDRNTCNRGGRRLNMVYYSKFWSYLAAYFPIKLRHSTEFKLNSSENYILNYHPHGISAFGAVTAFATNGLNFGKLFPGMKARFMVHETSFVVPVMKETFALRGDCSVNSKSIDYMLTKRSTGNLLTIVVGGLAEADMSEEEVLKTVILERKGFVKKALIHGANLIPCIAFGENSVFHKVNVAPDSFLHRLQTRWYNLFKFKHPIYFGKGIFFPKNRGLMPYKRPITVVMGDPIVVKRVVNPTQDDIDKLHATYVDQLKSMYDANDDLRVVYDKKFELF